MGPLPEFYDQLSKLLFLYCRKDFKLRKDVKSLRRVFDLLRSYQLQQYMRYRENLTKSGKLEKFIRDPSLDDTLSRTDINLIRPLLLGFSDQHLSYKRWIQKKTSILTIPLEANS